MKMVKRKGVSSLSPTPCRNRAESESRPAHNALQERDTLTNSYEANHHGNHHGQ